MAFSTRAKSARTYIHEGDEAILYAAGKMGPTGMAICGHVRVSATPALGIGPPIQGGRFRLVVPIDKRLILDEHNWVPIKPLIGRLSFLEHGPSWGWPLQRNPLEVSRADFAVLLYALRAAAKGGKPNL